MVLYTILKSLLIPPGILILMLGVAFFMVRGVMGQLLIFISLAILMLMSLPVVGNRLMQPLERLPAIGTDALPIPSGAQAIVILSAGRRRGAPEYGGDTLDDASLRRVRYGAALSRATGLPLYVTGGRLAGEDEAIGVLMAEVLRHEFGVRVVAVESESRTTWENAAYTRAYLARAGVSHILLVSDAWHLPRALEAFEIGNLRVTPAPTGFVHYPGWESDLTYRDWLPSAQAFQLSYRAIHEHLGRVWYQIRFWIQGPPGVLGATIPSEGSG